MSQTTVSLQPDDPGWRSAQGAVLLQHYSVTQLKSYAHQYGSPLLLLSLKKIREQYQTLQRLLPRVKHHYAMKPLPHPEVVKALMEVDGYFDLATNGEVDVVRAAGVDPKRCIHSHPIKRPSDVLYALEFGNDTFVFENEYELAKHAAVKDRTKWLMRLSFPNPEAQCDLSSKFGVLPPEAFALLKKAHELGYHIKGLSFHVGSQMKTPAKHIEAITFAKVLVDQARAAGIDTLRVLDLGGGWPVTYIEPTMPIEDFVAPIREALDDLFPDFEIFSEPGRFVAGPAVVAISSVMGKNIRNGQMMYYLDDGLYNSYSGILFDHGHYLIYSMKELENPAAPRKHSTLAGPTCDSIDVMYRDILMPEMELGDLLVSPVMGAYAGASHATDFNFFMRPKMVVVE
ncbi:MAG: type III PLP-dependent enzyme [bacterium]